ncbi:dTDP-glucose 4%2C6-dehydratase 2 [uncultured Clostridium sp.]|uniref:SDR family oxidoreductase n=1 Tax=uncultured Clostridium sp. TaxID=59620 RepID=UPI0008227F64|nr:SDR family oxidoreductase [uncultured Clostridium sp.]SCJ98223.1 dTDP-glucose 4%2C6-dehydratase 2 [uncultured Clostridium sp.]
MGYKHLKFPNDSKFLITGGAGFIGSNLCEAILNMGYSVRVLDNFSTGKEENINGFIDNEKFELIKGDIRDIDVCNKACKNVDYVLHQASWGSVPRSIEMPLIYEEINIKGTLNMMNACRDNNVKRFIYASSSSVYGDSTALPKIEGEEGNVISPYALTKKVCEEYGRLYYKIYGLETVGMRYFNVYGKRQDAEGNYAAVIPKFIKNILNDKVCTINGDGKQSRDFTYIENVIEANLKACVASNDVAGEVLNIAFGGREYLIDIYYKISRLLERDINPKFGQERIGDIKHSNASIEKAKRLIGYEPEYSFEDGLKLTIDWYKRNLT